VLKNKRLWVILSLSFVWHGNLLAMGDPTKPPLSVQLKKSTPSKELKKIERPLLLNAIKIEGAHRLAVINGEHYRVGQKIGKSRVKSISLNKVVLGSGKTLSLFDNAQVHVAKKGY